MLLIKNLTVLSGKLWEVYLYCWSLPTGLPLLQSSHFPTLQPSQWPLCRLESSLKGTAPSELSLVGSWSTAPFSVWFLGGLVDWFLCSCLFWGLCSAAVTSPSNSVFLSQSPKCWDLQANSTMLDSFSLALGFWLEGTVLRGLFFCFVLIWDGISYLWMTLSSYSPLTCDDRLLPLHLLYLVLLG